MKQFLTLALAAMMLLPVGAQKAQNVQKTKKTMVFYNGFFAC